MQRCSRSVGKSCNEQELIAVFRDELARTMVYEAGLSGEGLFDVVQKCKKGVSMPLRYLRRTRQWTDGGIIGSKEFI